MPGAQRVGRGEDGLGGRNNEEAEGEKGWVMWAFLVMAKITESPQKIEAGIAVSGCWQN